MNRRWQALSRIGAVVILTAPAAFGLGSVAFADTADYRIHPGDSVTVQVLGERAATQAPALVAPDGTIRYQLIGKVCLDGLTADEAAATIATRLAAYIKHPVVTVSVQQGEMEILVLGNVKAPGKYAMKTGEDLSGAIATAGGLGPTDGPFPDARISVGTQAIQTVSLQKLLQEGDVSLNVPLTANSVVYVSERSTIEVSVIGAVDHPGDVEVKEGDRLSLAIAMAGNSKTAQADLNHVVITRVQGASSSAISVNLYDELEKGDINADPVLQKGDVVYVPQAKTNGQAAGGILMSLRHFVFPWWY